MKLIKLIFSTSLSLGFSLVGLLIALETLWPMWQDWQTMQAWQPAQGQLIEVKSEGNQTYAKYSYLVNDQLHFSERVYVASFKDNIGNYQQDLQQKLNWSKQAALPIAIWINPDNYRQAVIDREMRWGLFILIFCFCSIFILIGLSLAYAFIRSANKKDNQTLSTSQLKQEWDKKLDEPEFELSFFEYRRQRLAEEKQEQEQEQGQEQTKKIVNNSDWRSRKGWEQSSINSNAKKSVCFYWGFSFFWYLLLSPLLFNFQDELDKGNSDIWWALILPIGGLFLLYQAIIRSLEFWRFGKVYFAMDPYPGAIGGQVGGKIIVPQLAFKTYQKQLVKTQVEVKLESVFSYNSKSRNGSERREDIIWAQRGEPKLEEYAKGTAFAFNYDLPEHLKEASIETTDSYYLWRLTIKIKIKGVDLKRVFIIPVFKGDKRSRLVSHSISEQVRKKQHQENEQTKQEINKGNFKVNGIAKVMLSTDLGHSLILYFPMFRNLILVLFAGLSTLGFGFFSFLTLSATLNSGYFGFIFGVISIPIVLLAFLSVVATVYLPLANLKVSINAQQIQVLKRWFYLPIYKTSMKLSEVNKVNVVYTGSRGSGVEKIENFKIEVANNSGKSLTISEDIEGKDVSLLFAEYLVQRFNIKAEVSFFEKLSRLKKNKNSNKN